eukprot:g48765.t1
MGPQDDPLVGDDLRTYGEFGFTDETERNHGRMAMIGFVAVVAREALTKHSYLKQNVWLHDLARDFILKHFN